VKKSSIDELLRSMSMIVPRRGCVFLFGFNARYRYFTPACETLSQPFIHPHADGFKACTLGLPQSANPYSPLADDQRKSTIDRYFPDPDLRKQFSPAERQQTVERDYALKRNAWRAGWKEASEQFLVTTVEPAC
jgi:hypothetical protein